MNPQFPMMPFLMPFMGQQQQGNGGGHVLRSPPARVQAAMSFLTDLTMKTMTRVAANEMSIQEITPNKLSNPEQCAQAAACSMLTKYFEGTMDPDIYDAHLLDAVSTQNHQGEGRAMYCCFCGGNPARPDCSLCHGSGHIIVFPGASEPRREEMEGGDHPPEPGPTMVDEGGE